MAALPQAPRSPRPRPRSTRARRTSWRDIRRRIDHLKEELEKVRTHRQQYRSRRRRSRIPVVALVGYTNAGKSTLLNRLSSSDVYVAAQLVATLDPTTRRVELPGGPLFIEWADNDHILMSGPAELEFEGTLAPDTLSRAPV